MLLVTQIACQSGIFLWGINEEEQQTPPKHRNVCCTCDFYC